MSNILKETKSNDMNKDSFLKKAAKPLVGKIRVVIKKIKRKFSAYNGNYYYGATAQDYESERVEKDWWHAENKIVSETLNLIPKELKVLDVPFGTGRFLPLYNERQMNVTGLDISYAMLATAKNLRKDLAAQCQFDVGNATNLPYEDNSFDLVLSFRFLDGIITFQDEKKVLSELVRVSRKYLILEVYSVPDGDDSKLLIENLKEDQPVMGRLSEVERSRLFKSFGIKVIKRTPAALEEGLRSVVYLCEMSNKEALAS